MKEEKFTKIFMKENIFNLQLADAIAYLCFYVIIPVIITAITFSNFPTDVAAGIYCYLSILINTLNCIYDAFGRWGKSRRFKNSKLFFFIILPAGIIAVYSLTLVFYMAITQTNSHTCCGILYIYCIPMLIASVDVLACFADKMAFNAMVESKESA